MASDSDPAARRMNRRPLAVAGAVIAIIAAVLVVFGWL